MSSVLQMANDFEKLAHSKRDYQNEEHSIGKYKIFIAYFDTLLWNDLLVDSSRVTHISILFI